MTVRIRDIIGALVEKTRSGEAKWQKRRFSGERDVYIKLGPYVLWIFETRWGTVVVKLKNEAGEEKFSYPVLQDDADFPLVSELLDLADPGDREVNGMLDDVRRFVLQAGPVGGSRRPTATRSPLDLPPADARPLASARAR